VHRRWSRLRSNYRKSLNESIKDTKDKYKLALIGAIHCVVRKAGIRITNEDQAIRFKKNLMNLNILMV
jgi:hypothetical protein